MKDFTIHKRSFTKGPYNKNYKGLHKIRVHNSTTQSSTQEVAQSQWGYKALGDHSRPQTLSLTTFYRVEYEIKLKKLCESTNSVRKNLRAWKSNENSFEKIALED